MDALQISDQVKLGFEFAKSSSEQLISLSTGILALSITFTKDIANGIPRKATWILGLSWLFYLVSIICGFDHLSALTGQLVPGTASAKIDPPLVHGIGEVARGPMKLQILTFGAATLLMLVYGVVGLRSSTHRNSAS